MTGQTTTDNTPSIWKWENTAHITKAGTEATLATASLSTAIVAILVLAGTIAAPFAVFSMFANPIGIAILSFAFLYFAAQAVSSYQQMKANLLIEDAVATVEAGAEKAVEAAVENKKLVTETELTNATKNLASKDELKTLATKDELKTLATKDELKTLATKDELKTLATKDELKTLATKDELKTLATKDELKDLVTEDELKDLVTEANLDEKVKSVLENGASVTKTFLDGAYQGK